MVRIALNVSCVWKADTSAMTTSGLARLERLNSLDLELGVMGVFKLATWLSNRRG